MAVSPCKGCLRELKDKNHPDCVNCEKRMEYWKGHGYLFESVPPEVGKMDNQEIEDAQLDNVEEDATKLFNGIGSLEHQICKDEDCKHAGMPQPIGEFDVHGRSGKPIGYCRGCMSRRKSLGRKKHRRLDKEKERQPPATDAAATPPVDFDHREAPEKIRKTAKDIIPATLTIDFTDHRETLEEIRKTAKELMREPEAQVLYWLVRADYDELERR